MECTDEEKEDLYDMLRQVLGAVVVLFSTLPIYSFSKLLNVPSEDINQTVEDLYSIIDVPEDLTQPIRLHHPSFRDFLLDKQRCKDPNFWVDRVIHLLLPPCFYRIQVLRTRRSAKVLGLRTGSRN